MNKALWIVGGIVLVAALFGGYSVLRHRAPQPTPMVESTTSTDTTTVTPAGAAGPINPKAVPQ